MLLRQDGNVRSEASHYENFRNQVSATLRIESAQSLISVLLSEVIMGLFGRNRGFLNSPEQVKVLSKVAEAQKSAQGSFSIRQAVADALKSSGFDDKGIGCVQEITLTDIIGVAFGVAQGQVERVEDYCKAKSQSEVARALQDAIRYAQ